ncbi:MAG: tRNA preQ1(34) S-adenosylmethionine ribosyltransferase-isomerase QueA [Spirochaetaceae bacterium]|nr:MAG: tRNA preQ1(34) S-adenosylmethionine ribosyltransferase-isomerase QueA [Spirochaetaceae bacterium]
MKTKDFSFEIPPELIAQEPTTRRDGARLLCLHRERGTLRHAHVTDLPGLLPPDALLVFNDTRVRHCRLAAKAQHSDRPVELLLLEQQNDLEWSAIAGPVRRAKPGTRLLLAEGRTAEVISVEEERVRVRIAPPVDDDYLDRQGHVPLPPYIRRQDRPADTERYQTVYARRPGSAAAPTAGLHFSQDLLADIDHRGIERRFVTLHVGLGTFRPIRSETVTDHRMHQETYEVPAETAEAVTRARGEGRTIVAVGTTSVRTLESAWVDGEGLRPGPGRTDLYIYPGYRFQAVDEMFTNFHTPESSLIVMVSAFAGQERLLSAYREAVVHRYRFFSYGDAMYIHR